jgi:SAM-dependent methyltransferase
MTHWKDFARRNAAYSPPLRPSKDVVEAITKIVGAPQGSTLLLGVTPELALAFDNVLAVDKSREMISTVWPGDSGQRRASCGDWLELDLAPGSIDRIVGDGSLNNIPDPNAVTRLLSDCLEWLAPAGRFACRVFERPARPFTEADITSRAAPGDQFNFHALKWMIAMHLAERASGVVAVESIRSMFQYLFPGRVELGKRTGWSIESIDTIDVYRNSDLVYYFPNREELLDLIPRAATSVKVSESGNYPLSHCCPIYSFAKNSESH